MTAEEIADRLRNSDCSHNTPLRTVQCAADCNRCIGEAIQAAVDAERRRLIPLVCWHCKTFDGKDVWRVSKNFWEHGGHTCIASPIYEAIRADNGPAQREENET